MKENRYYIAYGSNLNLLQMEHRCPTAQLAASAVIEDYQMLFRGNQKSAVATIEPSEGDSVPILIWTLQEADEQALDRYEGFPHFYHKETMELEIDEEITEAMVYIMNDGYEIGMPSPTYLNTILDGYDEAGFDPTAIEKAVSISKEYLAEKEKKTSYTVKLNPR